MKKENSNATTPPTAERYWEARTKLPAEIVALNLARPLLIFDSAELALKEIYILHQRSIKAGSYAFLLLTGQSGSGKSTILDTYWDAHRPETLEDRERIPVLYFEVPAAPSISAFASQILAALGDPAAHKKCTIR